MSETTIEKTLTAETAPDLDDGSSKPEDVCHYIDQRLDQDVSTAYIEGTELIALCGYKWVPFRDPQNLPICKPCIDALHEIVSGS